MSALVQKSFKKVLVDPFSWNQQSYAVSVRYLKNRSFTVSWLQKHYFYALLRSGMECIAMCSAREDCSLAIYAEGSSCDMAPFAHLTRDHGPKLEVYWDSGSSHVLKDPPREVCTWSDNFMADSSNEKNVYYHVGQVQDRDTCKEVLAKLVYAHKFYLWLSHRGIEQWELRFGGVLFLKS